ncbi:hypothetical protein AKO1_007101, partial [Acrasis kona]
MRTISRIFLYLKFYHYTIPKELILICIVWFFDEPLRTSAWCDTFEHRTPACLISVILNNGWCFRRISSLSLLPWPFLETNPSAIF